MKEVSQKKAGARKRKPQSRLSFLDRIEKQKELIHIQRQLNHLTGKAAEKPTTAQKTIPLMDMTKDGICRVTDKYYSAAIEFFDINFDLLDAPDKHAAISAYNDILNYFDASVNIQLFLFNRKVPEEKLLERINIPYADDEMNELREELAGILKFQMSKGKNGVEKSKYIIFGLEAPSVKAARNRIRSIETKLVEKMNLMGTRAKILSGKEYLKLLHDYFNQDTMKEFHFSYKDYLSSGGSVKNYIAPSSFYFGYPKTAKMGTLFAQTFYIDIISPNVDISFLKNLIDITDNVSISIHMTPIDPVKASKMVKKALSDLQKRKIDEQKRASSGGYDMDILPPELVARERDLLALQNTLTSYNEKLFQITFTVTIFAKNKKHLDSLHEQVNGIVQVAMCELQELTYQQELALMTTAPIGRNLLERNRTINGEAVAHLIPFATRELFQAAPAFYYGLNPLSNNMILADRKRLRTPNGLILGTPGSGKSVSSKREIFFSYFLTADDIIICDPEDEYGIQTKALKGEVVKLSNDSDTYINPLSIYLPDAANDRMIKNALADKSDFMITFVSKAIGKVLSGEEKGIIDACITKIYQPYIRSRAIEDIPVLENLKQALYQHENPLGKEIGNGLLLYTTGTLNYFNHHTNFDTQNRVICYNIKELPGQLKELGMITLQDAVWNRVAYNRYRRKATRYYCDEFHLLLRDALTADFSIEIWKRFRKWGGIPTGITQNASEFFKNKYGAEKILEISDFVYLLNLGLDSRLFLKEALKLSDAQLSYVTDAEAGCGLMKYDNIVIPFADHYPTDTKTFRIMDTKPE